MDSELTALGQRLLGDWITEATHPQLPGTVVTGWHQIEWLDGEQFLILRSHTDHEAFPDAISIVGETEGLHMHYFDSRGVHRLFEFGITGGGWTISMDRHAPAASFASAGEPFSQRITYTFVAGDQQLIGRCQLSYNDVTWDDDLEITLSRAQASGQTPAS